MQLFIEKVETGAEYEDVIHNFWIIAQMIDRSRIRIFDYNCFDLRNKTLTSIECLLYINLDASNEPIGMISGTYESQIQLYDWKHLADDISKDKKYSALKTTNGIFLFNEKEIGRQLVEGETLALYGVKNEYLSKKISILLGKNVFVNGVEEDLFACPCCQFRALKERGHYQICPVCFWEDDGSDDLSKYSHPNKMTLQEGRLNFTKFGAVADSLRDKIESEAREKFEK